jgi:putative aminopeptidase FrvX
MGNIIVRLNGTGAGPHRLLVAPIDEPGYVVSGITADGFLRVQRLPQQPPQALFDALHFAQPVSILSREGKRVPGVIAGVSVHLQPARRDAPKMDHPDDIYVDIGAASEAEARQAGVDVLDPLYVQRRLFRLSGNLLGGTAAGDRHGAAVLLDLAAALSDGKFPGTVTLAFLTQQWTGSRGLQRLLNEIPADEMIYIGRFTPVRTPAAGGKMPPAPGSGVLLGTADPAQPLAGFAAEIQSMAKDAGIALQAVPAGPLRGAASAAFPKLPERFAQLALPLDWPVTPIETVSARDMSALELLLKRYVPGKDAMHSSGGAVGDADFDGIEAGPSSVETILRRLSESYGASGHETAVREEVQRLLPAWAKTDTDASGNLILHLGDAKPGGTTPHLVFVAHMDELGFQVKAISEDGRLQVESLGGGQPQYYFGHPVLVHGEKFKGDAVIELPAGWEAPQFTWPSFRGETLARVDVGARNRAEAEALGIKPGDWITIEKHYRPLQGTRANARSFDDRVGCTALVAAVWALGQSLPGRDVTFIWSTEEEVGLRGAAAAAERLNAAGRTPQTVFAIDTFVSADSPLEGKRFADALIGHGFVVRAVDNSNVVPRGLADRVVALARQHKIPVQYGVTGGGNDGSVFTRFGAVDVALGWPLRYSHSAAEVIDTRDVHALGDIVAALAEEW